MLVPSPTPQPTGNLHTRLVRHLPTRSDCSSVSHSPRTTVYRAGQRAAEGPAGVCPHLPAHGPTVAMTRLERGS